MQTLSVWTNTFCSRKQKLINISTCVYQYRLCYWTSFLWTSGHRSWGTNILLLAPYFVLFEKKRKQHQHASIVHNPPDVNVAFIVTLMVAGVERHVFGNQQSQVGCGCAANGTCPRGKNTPLLPTVRQPSVVLIFFLKYVQQRLYRQVRRNDRAGIKQMNRNMSTISCFKYKCPSSKLSMRRRHLLCSNLTTLSNWTTGEGEG